MIRGDGEGFRQSLDANVVQHFLRRDGAYPTDAKVRRGAANVFNAYDQGVFKTTSNVDVHEWSVSKAGLSATVKCVIDQDKNINDGMQGRYQFRGECRFDFVRTENGELKIKEI